MATVSIPIISSSGGCQCCGRSLNYTVTGNVAGYEAEADEGEDYSCTISIYDSVGDSWVQLGEYSGNGGTGPTGVQIFSTNIGRYTKLENGHCVASIKVVTGNTSGADGDVYFIMTDEHENRIASQGINGGSATFNVTIF